MFSTVNIYWAKHCDYIHDPTNKEASPCSPEVLSLVWKTSMNKVCLRSGTNATLSSKAPQCWRAVVAVVSWLRMLRPQVGVSSAPATDVTLRVWVSAPGTSSRRRAHLSPQRLSAFIQPFSHCGEKEGRRRRKKKKAEKKKVKKTKPT